MYFLPQNRQISLTGLRPVWWGKKYVEKCIFCPNIAKYLLTGLRPVWCSKKKLKNKIGINIIAFYWQSRP